MKRETIKLESKIIASDTQELYDIAISKGIQLPHPALGIFKSVLAEVDKPNSNGVRLSSKATESAVNTLIGTQINRNHLRTDNVLGHTIDATINKDKEIEVTCIFFKDIYEDEWSQAQDLFKDNKLTMSFELSADVESQDSLPDGTRRINDYYFTGAGLLFGVKPACKKARVFEMATRKLYEDLTVERQELVFANEPTKREKIRSSLIRVMESVKQSYKGGIKQMEDVIKVEETPIVESSIVVDPIVEAKVEEVVAQPIVEQPKVEDVVVVTETTQVVTDTMSQNSETIKVETEVTRTVNDQEKEHTTTVQETTYTYAQVEEIKAEHEKQVKELNDKLIAKDAEILQITATAEKIVKNRIELASNELAKDFSSEDLADDLKVAEVKEKKIQADKLIQIKLELKDNEFAKDFSDADYLNSDKVELARMKKENVELKAKKEAPVEKVEAQVENLETGHEVVEPVKGQTTNPVSKMILAAREDKKNKK